MNKISSSNQTPPDRYGTSQHYLGASGQEYFARQKFTGLLSAQWNLEFWVPYISETDDILDFGCGGGYLLSILSGASKTGVEINPAARDEAKRMGLDIYPAVSDIPAGRLFDCIISNHALEHIPCPIEALKSLRTRLRPQGKLLLMLPLDDWRARHHRQFRQNDPHFHLYGWTPQNLGNLLVEAGFTPREIRVVTDAMPPLPLSQKICSIPGLRKVFGRLTGVVLKRRQLFAYTVVNQRPDNDA